MTQIRLLLLGMLVAHAAWAGTPASRGTGVGLIAGEPTGISVKHWLDPTHAVDAAAAWSLSENDALQLHADYLWHDFARVRHSPALAGDLPLYYGLGGRIQLRDSQDSRGRGHDDQDDDDRLGVRFPLGLAYGFAQAPFDIFIEIAPILDVLPDTDFELNAAVGARFYFR